MATWGTLTTRLAICVGDRRDAIDHDKRIADESGFDGGGAAGDDGGAGMKERGAGVVNQANGEAFGVAVDQVAAA